MPFWARLGFRARALEKTLPGIKNISERFHAFPLRICLYLVPLGQLLGRNPEKDTPERAQKKHCRISASPALQICVRPQDTELQIKFACPYHHYHHYHHCHHYHNYHQYHQYHQYYQYHSIISIITIY